MKVEKMVLRAMQICMVLAMFCVFYACSEENVTHEPEPPTEDPVPAGNAGEVEFDITNNNSEGGNNGEGSGSGTTPEDPAVATAEEGVDMTISAKSSYNDPNGTTFTCEPKATITLSVDLDTVYAKDIETLTKVIGNPNGNTKVTNNTGTNPANYTTNQTFNVGGQNVTFNLGYEVYTHTNSKKQKIEMPYVKVNNANFGACTPTETEAKSRSTETASVRLANVTVVPTQKAMSRSITVTDTTTYEVTARFNLDVESKNSANDSKQTLSFEVKYIAVITETIEYDGAKLTYEVQSNASPQNGVYVANDPEKPLEILVKQESSFMGTDGVTQTGSATTKITAVAPGDVYFANKDAISEDEVKKHTAITVEEENLTAPLPYYDFEEVKFEGYNIKSSNVTDTLETYHIVAKYSQVAKPVNVETATDKPSELKFAYQVEFIAKVKVELVDTKYRQAYEWLPAHDNIPWRYHFIVYRDKIYSNGKTVTDTFTSVNRIVEYAIHVGGGWSNNAKNSWEKDDHMDPNATDTLSYCIFGHTDVDADISKITETEIRDPVEIGYSDDFGTYENDRTGQYFSDSKTDGGWYYDRASYRRSFYIFYEGVLHLGSYPSIQTYNYFLYLDGKIFVFDRVDLSTCTSECTLEDAESDFRGKVKVLKHKFGIDWLGKHCRVELTDTIY